jgi:hypothetical protein
VESRSGKAQLKTIYDFFSRVPHDKAVMVVWDCDAKNSYGSLGIRNKTIPYIFEMNVENTVARKGIENLFPEELFSGYKKTIEMSTGEKKIEFDETRKSDFEHHILGRNQDGDFAKFESFIQEVKKRIT